ncbi:MAG: Holliday junction branch migration protein RuvA [Bacteroidota bacterium]|nr:Holliday junction branch migration protein RuvA [Bacteroidota bacterium]
MYEFIRGNVQQLSPTSLVLNTPSIGYFIHISLFTYSNLTESEEANLYIHQIIREDAHLLYGFSTIQEREIFRLLISVSGIGANTGRMILSALSPDETRTAIISDNVHVLKGIKGIGAKTAQRLIVDLRDKLAKTSDGGDFVGLSSNRNREESLSALATLGFSKSLAAKVLDKLISENPGIAVEDLIREALKRL